MCACVRACMVEGARREGKGEKEEGGEGEIHILGSLRSIHP